MRCSVAQSRCAVCRPVTVSLCCVSPCRTVSCCASPCYTVSCCAFPCVTVSCCALPCHSLVVLCVALSHSLIVLCVALCCASPCHNLGVAVAIPTASLSSDLQSWLCLSLLNQRLSATSILGSHPPISTRFPASSNPSFHLDFGLPHPQ